jgi:hypothetical protein
LEFADGKAARHHKAFSGQWEMPEWRSDMDVWHAFTLPDAPIKGVAPRSRGAMRPGYVNVSRPKEMRAQGKPGARRTRSLACKF